MGGGGGGVEQKKGRVICQSLVCGGRGGARESRRGGGVRCGDGGAGDNNVLIEYSFSVGVWKKPCRPHSITSFMGGMGGFQGRAQCYFLGQRARSSQDQYSDWQAL